MQEPNVADRPMITKLMYYTLLDVHKELKDELEYKIYRRGGKNKPGSPARLYVTIPIPP